MKNWYQIDKRQANGELIEYKMIKSNNRQSALQQYLGKQINFVGANQTAKANDYIITDGFVNGKFILNARALNNKATYYEVRKITQQ